MTTNPRRYSKIDQFCLRFDHALRAIAGQAQSSDRPYPAKQIDEAELNQAERKTIAGLMRVNHAGEVSAQALYHAQAFVSRDPKVREHMQTAALEEGDHLVWCQQRLAELDSHTSYLNPFWYSGSFAIGLLAGLIGDQWSLGFVAETETQVVKHLAEHLDKLPANDLKSKAILEQMQADEAKHKDEAILAGAALLPLFIKKLMNLTSKVMVKTAYWC